MGKNNIKAMNIRKATGMKNIVVQINLRAVAEGDTSQPSPRITINFF